MRIVIAGCGHAALVAIERLARQPLPPSSELIVVSEGATADYSGMLPGRIEGLYAAGALSVPIAPVVARAGGRFIEAAVTGLDAASQTLALGAARTLPFDLCVLNTGSLPAPVAGTTGTSIEIVPVKPIAAFEARIEQLLAKLTDGEREPSRIAIVGAGAGGTELALALTARATRDGLQLAVTLLEAGPTILPGLPDAVRKSALAHLARRGTDIVTDASVDKADATGLSLSDGRRVSCDAAILATPGAPPPFLDGCGLQRDARGFVATDAAFRSLSHPSILAVGDIGTVLHHPRPKAGVWSVRAGPPLADQLTRLARGEPARAIDLQRTALFLIATGFRRAIATRNGFTIEGTLPWWLKDRIDRRFVARFRDSEPS